MKKVLSVFAVSALLALAVACSSDPASKAKSYMDDYLAAMKKGDTEKAEKIEKEMDEWSKTLSEEDKKAVEAAVEEWTKANFAELLGAAMGGLE